MLKKKVATTIVASTRLCKCGVEVAINPKDVVTICPKCGATVYEGKKDIGNINGEDHETSEFEANDTSE